MRRIMLRILKALADDTRLKIINFLEDGEKSVGDIQPHVGTTQSNISQHLRILKDAELVDSRRKGKIVYYHITNKKIFTFLDLLNKMARENIEDMMD
ncbi:MAG: metalloregulator ArsR/SmtB family transcription factor [Euryarchaeota archaeon]|nr:metalloregulator ArsR/SmtB family transcription factor [Euryarchaeota archaeon]